MNLIPAYGRDYKSAKEVKADFEADKDFIISDMSSRWDGKPINKSQLQQDSFGHGWAYVRFDRLRKVTAIRY